jgi:tRNA threonylcarbamoyladenosine biosynthesis protein TsaE
MSGALVTLCHGEEATRRLGQALAAGLRPGVVLALSGDLGTGKTVLSRGIARGLGVREAVTSPTFTVVQEYLRPDATYLFHLDLYRIPDETAALAFGVDEYLFAADGIALVEWAERIEGLLVSPGAARPVFRIRLTQPGAEDTRRLAVPRELAPCVRSLLADPGSGVTEDEP